MNQIGTGLINFPLNIKKNISALKMIQTNAILWDSLVAREEACNLNQRREI